MSVGKTVSRIEDGPTDPEYRYARDDMLLVHFTDGSALRVAGSSYEEVSLGFDELSRDEVRAWARAAQGRRESARLVRLQREEYASLPEDVRLAREAARRAKMSPFARAVEYEMRSVARSFAADMNRGVFAGDELVLPKKKRVTARRS